ncbi:HEAT repeat-containing protein 1-like isoform X2 [Amblyomma americanum]
MTSVFTYKGASLLWQVDNCSFQTVMPTVKTVVPALLQACTGESKSAEAAESAVASVTRVFVGPFPDIPGHWWLSLFAKLATTLGAGDHLWILAAQMAEHQVTKMGGTGVDEVTFVRSLQLTTRQGARSCCTPRPLLMNSWCFQQRLGGRGTTARGSTSRSRAGALLKLAGKLGAQALNGPGEPRLRRPANSAALR